MLLGCYADFVFFGPKTQSSELPALSFGVIIAESLRIHTTILTVDFSRNSKKTSISAKFRIFLADKWAKVLFSVMQRVVWVRWRQLIVKCQVYQFAEKSYCRLSVSDMRNFSSRKLVIVVAVMRYFDDLWRNKLIWRISSARVFRLKVTAALWNNTPTVAL